MRWEGSHGSRPTPGCRLNSKRFSVTPRAPTPLGEAPPRAPNRSAASLPAAQWRCRVSPADAGGRGFYFSREGNDD